MFIRSAAAGTGNKWIVEFGEMLDQTLQSSEVRAAFARLDRDTPSPSRYELVLDLIDYKVWGFSVRIKLRAQLRREGRVLSDKVYSASGTSEAGTVVGGGVFAMRNALQVTNKDAVERTRVLILLASAPVAVLTGHTVLRFLKLLSR